MKSSTVRALARAIAVLVLVPLVPVLASAGEVRAATLTVTTLNDVVDANDGVLSLREAVAAATTGDVVEFSSSLFTSGAQVINHVDVMSKGGTFEIRGPGKDLLTIKGPRSDRTMVGYSIASNVLTVTLSSAPAFTASVGGNQGVVFIHSTTAPIAGVHRVSAVSGNTFTVPFTYADTAYTAASGEVASPLVDPATSWGLAGRFMSVTGGSILVRDMTIEGFMAERGGAFAISNNATLRLRGVRVRQNASFGNWCGGAIKADRGNIDIRDSIFDENLGKCDGAILMGDGNGTTMYIENTTFTDNISGNGRAIRSFLPTQMVNVSISGSKDLSGALSRAFEQSGFAMPLTITGSNFAGNGAVVVGNHSTTTITGSTFTTSTGTAALELRSTFATLTNNSIESCTTDANVAIPTASGNTFANPSNCALVNSSGGAKLVNFTRSANVVTMNTATAHGFSVGDVVKLCGAQAFSSAGWCGLTPTILSAPSSTSFTFSHVGNDAGSTVITGEAARAAVVFDQAATTPGAPVITGATAGVSQVVLTWSAPASGSASITDYLIQFSKNNGTWTTHADGAGTSTNSTITGLDNGESYRFRVAAVSSVGTGAYSVASSAVTVGVQSTTTTTTAPSTTVPSSTTTAAPSNTVATPTTSQVPAQSPSQDQNSAAQLIASVTTTVPVLVTTTTVGIGASSTTSAPTTTSTTSTTIPAPEAPAVQPGSAGALVDGEAVEGVVSRFNNALVVDVAGINATIWGISTNGDRIDLDETGNLRLNSQDSVVVEAEGFQPGQSVEVWMFSNPVRLGVLTAGVDGTVAGTFPLPTDMPAGDHRVVLEGENSLGQDVTVGVGLFVGDPTGDGVSPWVIWLPVSLAVGLALIIPTTIRRRRRQAQATAV